MPRKHSATAAVSDETLVQAAIEARRFACAPYSRFQVGAALLTKGGRIISGVNVESASYGLTCCAERVALFNALSQGEREFTAIAVVADLPAGPTPCGACRQLLLEYAPGLKVICAGVHKPDCNPPRCFSIEKLLPSAFLEVPTSPTTTRLANRAVSDEA